LSDHLPPGPVLAGLAADRWTDGLGRLADDELIGVLRAARRLASWATAMEIAALADLWRQRTADEDNGEAGAAGHAADEVAAALTPTPRAADTCLDLALALARLPLTSAALANGDIDAARAKVIADEVIGLAEGHAAAVEQGIIGAAHRQTTGQLRAATHRAALAADPAAAQRRKQEALREARVERWAESAGTASLAGRDLPPIGVLAADARLTALAEQLKAAGADGTMDTLRAHVYLALLAGSPLDTLLPTNQGAGTSRDATSPEARPGAVGPSAGGRPSPSNADGAACAGSRLDHGGGLSAFSAPAAPTRGSVNLTLPLATWLGRSDEPGHAAGYGPLDATDSRLLATALADPPGNRWCLTLTTPDGRPLAHGCANTGPPRLGQGARAGPGARDPAATKPPTTHRPPRQPRAQVGHAHRAPPHTGSGTTPGTWTFALTLLDSDGCDHAWQTPAYKPTTRLRHLVQIRHATCVFPGCRRPAKQCDADHTIPYDNGGLTCLCNLAPLCRRHHQAKQTPGWTLAQTNPGTMTWTTPSGHHYNVCPVAP
jgi:hypothetical protein